MLNPGLSKRLQQVVCSCVAMFLYGADVARAEVSEGRFASGMHVVVTGSGSAMPDPERAGASVVVAVDGKLLLFDFGRGVMESLIGAGINPLDVDYGFLTHLHFDHIASYDYFIYANWIAGRQKTMPVHGPAGTVDMRS
jgi:ribonuclease BN (tRNA processing enzyme)